MKLYIAGPMTNYPAHNFPAFNDAAKQLREAGYEVINPSDHGLGEMSWRDYMRRDLGWLLTCDGVAFLPGWTESRGAKLEMHVAQALDMYAMSVQNWVAYVGRWVA